MRALAGTKVTRFCELPGGEYSGLPANYGASPANRVANAVTIRKTTRHLYAGLPPPTAIARPQLLTPQVIVPAVLVPLIGYRLYRRFRSNFGPQPIQPQRKMVRIALLSVVVAMFVTFALRSPTNPAALLEALAGGLIAGAAVAVLGLRYTQFSTNEKGSFYTPNSYIGAAVTLLLVGRITYRMILLFTSPQVTAQPANPYASLAQSPLTLTLLMLTLGYYLTYTAGILIRSRKPAQG
jgi:hypothetical protein